VKIAFINGSPRKEAGISARLLRAMEERLPGCEIVRGWESPAPLREGGASAEVGGVSSAPAVLLIAFPLYVDGVPSNLLRELIARERALPPGTRVYVLVNNGFYEGTQNAVAVSMLRNWCERAGLVWGQGVGVGAGEILKREALMSMANIFARRAVRKYNEALDTLAANILAEKGGEDIFTNPGIPRALYMRGGDLSFRANAKEHGLKRRDIRQKMR